MTITGELILTPGEQAKQLAMRSRDLGVEPDKLD